MIERKGRGGGVKGERERGGEKSVAYYLGSPVRRDESLKK